MRKLLLALLILFSCSSLFAAPALVQGVANFTFAGNTTAGNTLIAGCQNNVATDNVTSVTDTEGNTWTRIIWSTAASHWLYIYATANIVGGTTNTVTFNGGATCGRVWYHEFSGMPSTLTLDGTPLWAFDGGSSTTCSPGALVTTNAVDLIFSIGMSNAGTVGGEPLGYTVGTTSISEDSEWRATTATGSYDPYFTTGSSAWTCVGMALQGSAGGPPAAAAKRRIL